MFVSRGGSGKFAAVGRCMVVPRERVLELRPATGARRYSFNGPGMFIPLSGDRGHQISSSTSQDCDVPTCGAVPGCGFAFAICG